MTALYVFWIRQVKKYLRSPTRIFGALGQPLLFLISLGFGLGGAIPSVGGVSYLSYLIPGIVGLSILFTSFFSGIELISDRRFGFLKETLVAPVGRMWIFLGQAFGGASIATMQGFLVLVISFLFGFKIASFIGLILAIITMFAISLLFTMLGLILATHIRDFQSFPIIINFVVFPIFFLSGAIFPLTNIPKALLYVTKINPLGYGIDMLRSSLIGSSAYSFGFSATIFAALLAIVIWWGTVRFNKLTA